VRAAGVTGCDAPFIATDLSKMFNQKL